jgi:glycosyltransferase involved in cell wall biosynthesis
MRLLNIHSGNLFGGVESLLITLTEHQHCVKDLEADFCLSFEGRLATELRKKSTVHMLNEIRLRRPWTVQAARRRLQRILSANKYDVAMVHSAWSHYIFGKTVIRAGVPLVFCVHDDATGAHWLQRLAKRFTPDLVLCVSGFTTSSARRLFPRMEPNVLYWPVTISESKTESGRREQIRTEFGAQPADVVIIQVSRLERWKGHDLHLKALALLKNVSNWKCWLVGGVQNPAEQVYLKQLLRQTADLGLSDRVKFLGQRSDVPALLAAADIHCQPNIGPEPFGRTFVEGMLASLPVVTTNMGAAPEIIDASTGILVPPNSPDSLAQSLKTLIEDRELRDQMGRSGIRRAQALYHPTIQLGLLKGILSQVALRN